MNDQNRDMDRQGNQPTHTNPMSQPNQPGKPQEGDDMGTGPGTYGQGGTTGQTGQDTTYGQGDKSRPSNPDESQQRR